jgi:hypothetical protein
VLRDRGRAQALRRVPPAAVAGMMEDGWLAAKRREKAFAATRAVRGDYNGTRG